MASGTLAEVTAWMKAQVGVREGSGNANRYSKYLHRPPEAWCADFVLAGLRIAGVPDLATSAYTPTSASQYKAKGRWTLTPRPGAQGYVYSVSAGRIIHTFWVWGLSRNHDYVYTFEGNTNDNGSANGIGVFKRIRPTLKSHGYSGVIGYGLPLYKPARRPAPSTSRGNVRRLFLSRTLQVGNSGTAVRNLQRALNAQLVKYTITVDGQFGDNTKRSVQQFQKDKHLTADGVVGPKTAAALGWRWVG